MTLTGLHLLLTYECNYECDHCFVWGSPRQNGTMTLRTIRSILKQGVELGSVSWIYFEGGEPFIYYPILVSGVQEAAGLGFRVGLVSNAYWATEVQDAIAWLEPMAGLVEDLSISSDLFHSSAEKHQQAINAQAAAEKLGIPLGTISIAQPEEDAMASSGQLPDGQSAVMYRGRAVEALAPKAVHKPWDCFTECPYEDLREPGRIHIDPLGYVHICQGISLGNVFDSPLSQICQTYNPETHPIVGPLLQAGPAGLVRHYDLPHQTGYADACHLCYEARKALRQRFPDFLLPGQMYGQMGAD